MIGPGDSFAEEGATLVRERTDLVPRAALILGSGLGEAASAIEPVADLSFDELPGMLEPSAPGHAGRLVLGTLAGVPVAAFRGRIHHYEGHGMDLATLPARLAAALGATTLVVTTAVGAVDPALSAGAFVVVTDHLSFLGESPLRGWRDDQGRTPFIEMAEAYDPTLSEAAFEALEAEGPVARGIYAAMPGPAYETPAEVEFLRRAGASVVGMSMVPEIVAGVAVGLHCLGLSCVANAVGEEVDHDLVTRVASEAAPRLARALARVLPTLDAKEH